MTAPDHLALTGTRRAAALLLHYVRTDSPGIAAVIEECADGSATLDLVLGLCALYFATVPNVLTREAVASLEAELLHLAGQE